MRALTDVPLSAAAVVLVDGLYRENYITAYAYTTAVLWMNRDWINALVFSLKSRTTKPSMSGPPLTTQEEHLLFDALENAGITFNSIPDRKAAALALEAQAHSFARSNLDPSIRSQLSCISSKHTALEMQSVASYYSGSWYDDVTIGGCNVPWRPPSDRRATPTEKDARRLESKSAICKYVKKYQDCAALFHLRELHKMSDDAIEDVECDELAALCEKCIQEWKPVIFNQSQSGIQYSRPVRKALTRAVTTASNILGVGSVQNYLCGKPVVVQGGFFNFSICRTGGRIDLNLSNSLTVLNKNGRKLADLCLHFKDMPTVDQLTAVALYIQAGEELDLIETGNPSGLTPLGKLEPMLMRDKTARLPMGFDQKRKEAYTEYEARVLPLYREAVYDYVWGRNARNILCTHDALLARRLAN